jgi:hypothetical protein
MRSLNPDWLQSTMDPSDVIDYRRGKGKAQGRNETFTVSKTSQQTEAEKEELTEQEKQYIKAAQDQWNKREHR